VSALFCLLILILLGLSLQVRCLFVCCLLSAVCSLVCCLLSSVWCLLSAVWCLLSALFCLPITNLLGPSLQELAGYTYRIGQLMDALEKVGCTPYSLYCTLYCPSDPLLSLQSLLTLLTL
jgi:urea transporter